MPKKFLIPLLIVFLTSCSYLPEPPAKPEGISITEKRDYLFIEAIAGSAPGTAGLILYPGGLVDPHAYLSLCSAFALSGEGHQVIIAKMPANLAVLDIKAAKGILKDFDDREWVIAGHSLGGAMACSLVKKETGLFRGMILLAAYPSGSADLSAWQEPVLSITATEDKVVDWDNYNDGKKILPKDTQYESIQGGNHAGFGQYGEQKGDGVASISQAEQQARIIELMQSFFLEHGLE